MKTRTLMVAGFGLLVLLASLMSLPVSAAPEAQFTAFPTPTPGPDGRIIYIAQESDSAWRIAAIFNIPLDKLRELNKWGENPVIRPGDQILLGLGGPAMTTPTAGPSQTPSPSVPTTTPLPGWGELCLILYNDLNGDSLRQEEEPSLPGGALSISNQSGTVSRQAETITGLEHQCEQQLPEGEYNISVAVPEGYNSTTVKNRTLELVAGDKTYLDFGAQANAVTQANSETILEAPPAEGGGRSPLLGIIGALFLVVSLGLAIFAGKLSRSGLSKPS